MAVYNTKCLKDMVCLIVCCACCHAAPAADLLAVYQRALQNDPQLREADANRLAALESRRRWIQAQTDYSRSRYDYMINVLKLQQAAGILSEQSLNRLNGLLSESPQPAEAPPAPAPPATDR